MALLRSLVDDDDDDVDDEDDDDDDESEKTEEDDVEVTLFCLSLFLGDCFSLSNVDEDEEGEAMSVSAISTKPPHS